MPNIHHTEADSPQIWALMDELAKEADEVATKENVIRGFYYNREMILDGWKRGHVRCLDHYEVSDEADILHRQLHDAGAFAMDFFGDRGPLPAFVLYEPRGGRTEIDIIWVRQDCRRAGLATKLLEELPSPYVTTMLPEAVPFWGKLGIPLQIPKQELPDED